MKRPYFNYGIASIIAVLVSASLAPKTVFAAESAVLEEIVVTAQRRAQNIQDVPIAITAFSGEDLEKSNIAYYDFLEKLKTKINSANSEIRNADRMGAFEASDEVGTSFKIIKEVMDDLNRGVN